MSRDLLTNLAAALEAIDGGAGYITAAGRNVQIGGTLPDRPELDQIVVRLVSKNYRAVIGAPAEQVDYASGTVSRLQADYTFEVVGVSCQLEHDSPGERIADLLDDIERALMLADQITAGGRKYPIQIVSADITPRADGTDAETVTVTIRLSGPQAWQQS